jgi:hypothetical protein
VVVLAICLHQRAHILPEFLQRRPPNEPPPIVDRMDLQVGSQGKGIGQCHQAVFEIGRCDFDHVELSDGLTLVIAEKCERRSQSGSESRADFGRIRTDDRQLTVVDLQVFLQLIEAPNQARAFWSPIAAVEAHDQRKAFCQL